MMSAEVQPLGASVGRKLQPGESFLIGLLGEVKRTEKGFYSVLTAPSPDKYSHPGLHEIQSKRSLGRPGDEVQVVVRLGGYITRWKDKEGNSVASVRNTIRVVED